MAEQTPAEKERARQRYNDAMARVGGTPVDSEGAADMDRARYNQLMSQSGQLPEQTAPEQPEDYFGSGIIEPAIAVGESLIRFPASGIAGLASQAYPGGMTGAERVEEIQAPLFTPKTPSGQKNMQRLGDLVEFGIDVTRLPFAIAEGVINAVTQGPEAGNAAIDAIMDDGLGQTLGDRVYDQTGSPAAAGIATAVPEAVAATFGAKLPGRVQTPRPVSQALDIVSPARRERRGMMETGSSDGRTAGYRIEPLPDVTESPALDQPRLPAPEGSGAEGGAPEYITNGGTYRRIERDPIQKAAVGQGFDPGVVTMVREASPADRARFNRMVDAREKSLFNPAEAANIRPGDVAGEAVLDRLNYVVEKNREAGKELDAAIGALPRGELINVDGPMTNFLTGLKDLGIKINRNWEIDFDGSMLEGTNKEVRAAQKVLIDVINRARDTRAPDAFDVHRLKKYIDGMVKFGTSKGGALGEAEYVMKGLRADLNDLLAGKYESYAAANAKYSDTINAMSLFTDSAGRKIDFTAPSAASMAGQAARKLMSNTVSRGNFADGLAELTSVAEKYGGEFDSNVNYLVTFANELDKAKNFGPVAETSFAGQISQSIPTPTQAGLLTRAADYAYDKIKGVTNETKLAALRELIGSFD